MMTETQLNKESHVLFDEDFHAHIKAREEKIDWLTKKVGVLETEITRLKERLLVKEYEL